MALENTEIKHVLQNALTNATDIKERFIKGIDRSYRYEGYSSFKMEKL